jgi:hypothetical protein
VDLGNDPARLAAGGEPLSRVAQEFKGKRYMLSNEVSSWDKSKRACMSIGGRLALPTNDEENRFLAKMAKDAQIEGAWLGASNKNLQEQWLSLDGSDLAYANWDEALLKPVDGFSQQYYPLLLCRDAKWAYQPNISTQYRPGYICQWD